MSLPSTEPKSGPEARQSGPIGQVIIAGIDWADGARNLLLVANPNDKGSDRDERDRRRVERILPELFRRFVESGYEKLSEGPESLRQLITDLRLPKETLALLLSQFDDTKNGLYRAVAREVREFLERTSLPDELARTLTRLSLEIRTEVRFLPNEAGSPKPNVQSKVALRREGSASERRTATAGSQGDVDPGPSPRPEKQDQATADPDAAAPHHEPHEPERSSDSRRGAEDSQGNQE